MKVKVEPASNAAYCYGDYKGFTKLAQIEWSNEPWQFNITGVWRRDSDNTLWYAHDCGCSCPAEWEDTWELERLFNMDPLFARYKEATLTEDDGYRHGHVDLDDWLHFKQVVENALNLLTRS